MFLKIASWTALTLAITGVVVYFVVYDRMTREALRVLWVDSPQATDLRNILDEFTDATSIPVQVDSVPRPVYRESIERELSARAPTFDVVIGDANWMARDVARGFYVDNTELVRGSWLFGHYDTVRDGELYRSHPIGGNTLYSVPVSQSRFGIVYRADLFADEGNKRAFQAEYGYPLAVPTTLSAVTDVAEFFTKTESGRAGVVFAADSGQGALTEVFLALLLAQGGVYADRDTYRVQGFLNSEKAVAVLNAMRAWYRVGDMQADLFTKPATTFAARKAVMLIAGSGTLRTALKEFATSTARVARLPVDGVPTNAYVKLYVASVVTDAQRARAAEELFRWLGTRAAQEFSQAEGGISVTAEIRAATTTPANPTWVLYDGTAPTMFFSHHNNEVMLQDSDTRLHAYIAGTNNLSAQETLDVIAKDWEKLLRE